jgi:hypothetical protein
MLFKPWHASEHAAERSTLGQLCLCEVGRDMEHLQESQASLLQPAVWIQ